MLMLILHLIYCNWRRNLAAQSINLETPCIVLPENDQPTFQVRCSSQLKEWKMSGPKIKHARVYEESAKGNIGAAFLLSVPLASLCYCRMSRAEPAF